MTSADPERQKSITSKMERSSKKGLGYFASAGLILLNIGLFGVSLLTALLSIMMFDAPNASLSSAAWVSFILLFTMPLPLGAAVVSSILLHGKERFSSIVVVTSFSGVHMVLALALPSLL